ncbi:unnamed protein product [Pedinophyceae sp. YPF-701]|nr:unnamed protein product [Pedinophyceae sp. YPF-701]
MIRLALTAAAAYLLAPKVTGRKLTLRRPKRTLPKRGPVNGLVVRDLEAGDFHKGFLDLLAQLTDVGQVTEETFKKRLKEINRRHGHHVYVIEDVETGRLVATAAVMTEQKFIHSCGQVAHVEDVVVDASVRGKGLGRLLVNRSLDIAKFEGCYKLILDCSNDNVAFYQKCGLEAKERQMVKYL